MADVTNDYPTIIGADAKIKGELSFEKGVRIDGSFEGQIKSKGSLHIAEGAKVVADVEASNVQIEGECKGNLIVSEKLHLMATARMDGDLRTNRLEIADGAIFVGKVIVGQASPEPPTRRPASEPVVTGQPPTISRETVRAGHTPVAPGAHRTRPQDLRMSPGS